MTENYSSQSIISITQCPLGSNSATLHFFFVFLLHQAEQYNSHKLSQSLWMNKELVFRDPWRYLQLCKEAKECKSINKNALARGALVCQCHVCNGGNLGFCMDTAKGKKFIQVNWTQTLKSLYLCVMLSILIQYIIVNDLLFSLSICSASSHPSLYSPMSSVMLQCTHQAVPSSLLVLIISGVLEQCPCAKHFIYLFVSRLSLSTYLHIHVM